MRIYNNIFGFHLDFDFDSEREKYECLLLCLNLHVDWDPRFCGYFFGIRNFVDLRFWCQSHAMYMKFERVWSGPLDLGRFEAFFMF